MPCCMSKVLLTGIAYAKFKWLIVGIFNLIEEYIVLFERSICEDPAYGNEAVAGNRFIEATNKN